MKKKRQGFTLIELLAVIVILGLLMAIAIPSVTKYITQSRKKTVTTTIGNYIGALTNQVNDMEYTFTAANTVYAVPIECIALERGGTNPFGEWHQASDSYWAYVLVQYDDATSSYTYGFTFKDSAGYGLYPTTSEKLNENGSQINTGLNLTKPRNGTITNITAKTNWTGFDVEDNTNLVVLEAESEGTPGNGKTTCTLAQKGSNYDQVEEEKANRPRGLLVDLIKQDNTLITAAPTLTTSINNSSDVHGLYSSTDTNSGNYTYYFRGKNINNYVLFADFIWRIIRINEDGTVRLILVDTIGTSSFHYSYDKYVYMYYSNSRAKSKVNSWYNSYISNKGYDSYVATGFYCQQAKAKRVASYTSGNATMIFYKNYNPNFKCETDGNGYGILKLKVGLITYDEVVYAGGYAGGYNGDYYLNARHYYTMSPAGHYVSNAHVWYINTDGYLTSKMVTQGFALHPVINLNANVTATGTGTSSDPYVVKTN